MVNDEPRERVPSGFFVNWPVAKGFAVSWRRGSGACDRVYVVTDGVWQSAFAVTGAGVVVFDAPETYAAKIQAEIAEVTSQPITTLVYSPYGHNIRSRPCSGQKAADA